MKLKTDTIAAIATAAGRGGVGIIRISGEATRQILEQVIGFIPKPRYAQFAHFRDAEGRILDSGLVLFFPDPNSFTGEDVAELQGHGGPVILDILLKAVLAAGARMARPGEFSERAFLNDKIDLAQAEAIADLIDAASEQAARSATRSLQGEFSKRIQALVEQLIMLRMYVEAAIDFPEEEIDFLSDGKVTSDLKAIVQHLQSVMASAKQGVLLKEGMNVVIAGKPNAGKSSLLNCLSGRETAIVTHIAGTTRDVLREHIQIDGLPIHIIDTAGLRETDDPVEQEGVRRAYREVEQADAILLVIDNQYPESDLAKHYQQLIALNKPLIVIYNKADIAQVTEVTDISKHVLHVSAKTGDGIDALKHMIKQLVAFHDGNENQFIARRRHINALEQAQYFLTLGNQQLQENKAGELLADDLLQAQNALSEITGEFTSDDLLGKIFSSFCIGK